MVIVGYTSSLIHITNNPMVACASPLRLPGVYASPAAQLRKCVAYCTDALGAE
jgi:hypothetical protein